MKIDAVRRAAVSTVAAIADRNIFLAVKIKIAEIDDALLIVQESYVCRRFAVVAKPDLRIGKPDGLERPRLARSRKGELRRAVTIGITRSDVDRDRHSFRRVGNFELVLGGTGSD